MKKLSGGIITDLAYLSFVIGLFELSKDKQDRKGVVKTSIDYKTYQRITRNIDKICKKTKELFVLLPRDELKRIRRKQKLIINAFVITMPKETHLDSLGLWILYNRFVERDKPLIKELQWLKELNYDYLSDMIDKNNNYTKDMYEFACSFSNMF